MRDERLERGFLAHSILVERVCVEEVLGVATVPLARQRNNGKRAGAAENGQPARARLCCVFPASGCACGAVWRGRTWTKTGAG